MKIKRPLVFVCLAAMLACSTFMSVPQSKLLAQPPGEVVETAIGDVPLLAGERTNSFRRTLIRASRQAVADGKITRREASQLRIASLSPNFRGVAQNLFLVELSFSGEDTSDFPRKASGEIDSEKVGWETLIPLLIEFLPILLQLLVDYGIIGGGA